MQRKMNKNQSKYMSNGVNISPAIPSSGDKVTISYNGLLAKSGATEVLSHVGFGNKWDRQYDYKMNKTDTGFQTSIPVPITKTRSMNLCFKDSADNWDNNNGMNYSFEIK